MSVREDIVSVLSQAEVQLASRLQNALEDREYSDVVTLASVSQQVHELIQSMREGKWASEPTTSARSDSASHVESHNSIPRQPKINAPRQRAVTYPKFSRRGNRLVKIGWSKRDRAEYEHRAEKSAVSAVVSALRGLEPREFTIDALTPVHDQHGTEIPSYQVYLVVAWLRACGAVEKAGRGGYVLDPERLTVAAVNELWAQLGGDPVPEGASIDD